METLIEKYDYSVKIRDFNVKFRKWKVKDKKKFIANKDNKIALKESLVYDCLEDKKLALSEEEFKFMLIQIREASLSDKIEFNFICSNCDKEFNYIADLTEIMKGEYKNYGDISYKGHRFTIGSILNRDFYEEMIQNSILDETNYLIDFMLHIKSYNDNDAFTFEELNEIINNLDIDIFEHIFTKWEEMRFKVNNIHNVICPHCNFEELYEFDDLPHFFPDSWDL